MNLNSPAFLYDSSSKYFSTPSARNSVFSEKLFTRNCSLVTQVWNHWTRRFEPTFRAGTWFFPWHYCRSESSRTAAAIDVFIRARSTDSGLKQTGLTCFRSQKPGYEKYPGESVFLSFSIERSSFHWHNLKHSTKRYVENWNIFLLYSVAHSEIC